MTALSGQLKAGMRLRFDDDIEAHEAEAIVLEMYEDGFTCQFDDRFRPTRIRFDEPAWMNHITVESRS